MDWREPPSIQAIFAWAGRRVEAHWPGLFVIAFVPALVPMLRVFLERGDPAVLDRWVQLGFSVAFELVLLLATAAMLLLAVGPDAEGPDSTRVTAATRAALHDTPRLVLLKIVTMLVRWAPALALAWMFAPMRSAAVFLLIGLALIPLDFIARVAFAGGVIERTDPIRAVADAFNRARLSSFGVVVGLAILVSLIEQLPPLAIVWLANVFFPPSLVPMTVPTNTSDLIPFGLNATRRFGSGIPWQGHLVMLAVYVPFRAYVTVLYAAVALAFADPDAVRRPPDATIAGATTP